jgi:nucleotide-binding universal stress UspA family protein
MKRTKKKSTKREGNATFRRLLVPVDFSDSSAHALSHAVELAAESGGSLLIVHVVPADYGWLGIGRDDLRELDSSLQQQAADRLRSFTDESLGRNVAADLEVRLGRPAEEIVRAASESKCDAIVLSTRGVTGLDRYFIGSVADRVARLAPCPVFLIPPERPAIARGPMSSPVLRLKHRSKGRR